MLVAAGANLSLKDFDGQTAMMLSFHAGDQELAAYLESKKSILIRKFQRISNIDFTTSII